MSAWKNQLRKVEEELHQKLANPEWNEEIQRESNERSERLKREMVQLYQDHLSQAAAQAMALRWQADQIEVEEMFREKERHRLERIEELRRIKDIIGSE